MTKLSIVLVAVIQLLRWQRYRKQESARLLSLYRGQQAMDRRAKLARDRALVASWQKQPWR